MRSLEKTSYRRKVKQSEAEWGSYGHDNWFGGFHRTTDTYAYVGLVWLFFKNLKSWKTARWILHMIHWRWIHRACDTVDFHHYACTLDPFGKKIDDEYRWKRVWTES